MTYKGFAPIIIIAIAAAALVVGGIGGYTYFKLQQNKSPEPIGGQTDEHGCLIAAGYSWCEAKQKCLRSWEEPCEETTTISSTTTTTTKVSSAAKTTNYCLDWKLFENSAYKDGNFHNEIKIIQEKLGVTSENGIYGPLTKEAIEKFNKKYQLYLQNLCCGATPEYIDINRGTISKFNQLYCDKPLYKVSIAVYNSDTECPNEKCEDLDFFIQGYNELPIQDLSDKREIMVPYSSEIVIINSSPRCSISKIYVNNKLAAYDKNPKDRLQESLQRYQVTNSKEFFFSYNPNLGGTEFILNNLKEDTEIKIETVKCPSQYMGG